jgi:hypothetical protein
MRKKIVQTFAHKADAAIPDFLRVVNLIIYCTNRSKLAIRAAGVNGF